MTAALETAGLGYRYRRTDTLRDCSLQLSAGRIAALIGRNGAGKSTLLRTVAGLATPTSGTIRVLGDAPGTGRARRRTALLAQHRPLHTALTVTETLRYGQRMNPGWDQRYARELVDRFELDPAARVSRLSVGTRGRLALLLTLAKNADLVLLDEPLTELDPIARHEVTSALLERVAETGATVLIASHVLAELDGVCDHLLLLRDGRLQLAGDTDDLLAAHRLLVGHRAAGQPTERIGAHQVIGSRPTEGHVRALVRLDGPLLDPNWTSEQPTLEELAVAYLRETGPVPKTPAPTPVLRSLS